MWGGEEGRRSPTLALYNSQQQAACRGQWKRGYGAIGLLAVRQLLWMSLVAPHSEKVNRRRHGRCCRGRRATEILVVLLTFIPCGVNPENEFSSPFILVLMTLCKPTATTEWRHCSLVWLGKWKPAAVVYVWLARTTSATQLSNQQLKCNEPERESLLNMAVVRTPLNEWKNGIGGFQKNFIYSTTGATRWTLSGWKLK